MCIRDRCFSYWKEDLVAARHEKMIQRWPEPHYNRNLQRRYMGDWREVTRLGRRTAVDQFWQNKMESMSTSIVAEYENQMAAMQAELMAARRELDEERQSRSKLYDDLMSQFRRGVCAFNLEALAALKPEDAAELVPSQAPLRARTVSERNSLAAHERPQPAKSSRRVGLSAGVRTTRVPERETVSHGVVRSVREMDYQR
eukprot:TRINITY_DN17357_c0_g1_i1.p1 TRINITY_DN17357_c0_g1~~TRINITY_DN17357_c0_g1_i1.p1  ORF type:complete len:200 (+),score=51.53 TRINITY_DN17357_c0_g1_i1:166-765(+)